MNLKCLSEWARRRRVRTRSKLTKVRSAPRVAGNIGSHLHNMSNQLGGDCLDRAAENFSEFLA